MSLRFRLLAGTAGAVILFGAVVMAAIHRGISSLLAEELTRRGRTVADALAASGEDLLLTDDIFALSQTLRAALGADPDVRYIFVADGRNKVVCHTFAKGFPRALEAASRLPPGENSRTTPIDTEEGPVQDIALAFPIEDLGSVHVGMSLAGVGRRILRKTLGWGAAALAALCLGAGFVFWTANGISARVQSLVAATERVGKGDLDARAPAQSDDELGILARAFNAMTGDLRQYQAQAIQAERLAAIGKLASCIAHEINNPLNTMAVCAQLLLERRRGPDGGAPDPAESEDHLNIIDGEIARCRKITSDLLELAHPREPHWAPTDINQVVAETLSLLEHRFREARCVVKTDLDGSLPRVRADAGQLKQVLINIVNNAVDHLESRRLVRVRTFLAGRDAAIRVADTGRGMAPEIRARIFDLFFTTKKPGEGTGLGLAICQKIVGAHGGRIDVESEPGEGSAFTVLIPVGTAAETPPAAA